MESSPPKEASANNERKTKNTNRKTSSYPTPFTISPLGSHKQTLILLHGRGSDGRMFGQEFLQSRLSRTDNQPNATLQTTFPNMKFIFPTAKPRRAKWYNRATINQWFDNVPIDEQDSHGMTREEEEWQIEGLRESREYVKGIVDEEVGVVGSGNVFIGGLSQGYAMGLHFFLSYEGRLGGFVGMSGWLPFVNDVEGILHPHDEDGNEDDPIDSDSPKPSTAVQVCNYIRDNMDLLPLADPRQQPACLDIPVFLGHGIHDDKVKIAKGRQAAEVLRMMDAKHVNWKEYDEGHWYKTPEEIDDIVEFLQSRLGSA